MFRHFSILNKYILGYHRAIRMNLTTDKLYKLKHAQLQIQIIF